LHQPRAERIPKRTDNGIATAHCIRETAPGIVGDVPVPGTGAFNAWGGSRRVPGSETAICLLPAAWVRSLHELLIHTVVEPEPEGKFGIGRNVSQLRNFTRAYAVTAVAERVYMRLKPRRFAGTVETQAGSR